jgi:hypothetical protein
MRRRCLPRTRAGRCTTGTTARRADETVAGLGGAEGTLEDGGGARPEIVITLELQGYGLQPVIIPPTVQTQVLRVGAELVHEQPDHLTTRLVSDCRGCS